MLTHILDTDILPVCKLCTNYYELNHLNVTTRKPTSSTLFSLLFYFDVDYQLFVSLVHYPAFEPESAIHGWLKIFIISCKKPLWSSKILIPAWLLPMVNDFFKKVIFKRRKLQANLRVGLLQMWSNQRYGVMDSSSKFHWPSRVCLPA